ncbi:MAG: response regulator [Sporomusaceae bacterium]|nr:response regulator [Sporomusaceae bacterium]
MREYRVLLVEQNRIMLERLSSVIRGTKDFQLVSRSADAREALGQGGVFLPNLILLDVDMADNVQLIRDFVKAFPQAAVLCLGSQWSAQAAGNAVKAGAKGYLIKPFTGEELIAAVHTFGSGGMGSLSEVLTFFSPKGKSGKTTLIANLALALARQTGQQVAIIDADLQFGDMAVFFNLEPQTTLVEAARDIAFLSPISLNAYFTPVNDQVKVLCGTKRPEFAENVGPRALTEIISMARSLFRYILIDVPPAFNPASVAAAEAADRVYLVAMVSGGYEVTHMRRALEIFHAWPDYAAKVCTVFTRAEPEQRQPLAAELGYPVCAVLPNEYLLVAAAANNGRMAVDIKPGSPLTGAIDNLAAQICQRPGAG